MSCSINLAAAERLASRIHDRHGSFGLVVWVGFFCIVASEAVVLPALLFSESLQEVHFAVGTMVLAGSLSISTTMVLGRIIDQRERVRASLDHLAHHDELTGVLNRRGFFKAADELIKQDHGQDTVVVAMVDLDRFKRINDNYGHAVGDLVLQRLARNLKVAAGDRWHVGRLGGDEFGLIGALAIHELDESERLVQQALAFDIVGCAARASVGFAVLEPGDTVDMTLSVADRNLYGAKKLASNLA